MNSVTIGVIDYEMGNVGSVLNMLRKIGVPAVLSRSPNVLAEVDKLILPGVGKFDRGVSHLREFGLVDLLGELVVGERKPILGICLGMQLLTRHSEEGELPGLGWIDAEVKRFAFDGECRRKVPHMGWTHIRAVPDNPIFASFGEDPRFYFVHSYYVTCTRPEDVTATAQYGHDFVAGFQHDNIAGVQFHPEKSHRFGLQLLKDYALAPESNDTNS